MTGCLTHLMGDLSTDARLNVVVAMVMSLVFTIVAAPFARAAYHRRVQRLMTFREVRSPPAPWWVRREGHVGRSAIAANVIEAEHPAELAQTMRYRLQRIRRATFVAYVAFAVGTVFSTPLHSGAAAEFAIAAAALGIGPALVNATPRTIPRFIAVLVIALLSIAMTFDRFKDFASITFGVGLVFAFYLIGTNRTLRALSVPLFLIGFGAFLGIFVASNLQLGLRRCFAPLAGC